MGGGGGAYSKRMGFQQLHATNQRALFCVKNAGFLCIWKPQSTLTVLTLLSVMILLSSILFLQVQVKKHLHLRIQKVTSVHCAGAAIFFHTQGPSLPWPWGDLPVDQKDQHPSISKNLLLLS